MNENDLYRSFQQIDDDILERSEGIAKKNGWVKYAIMATFLGIVIIIGMLTILREHVRYVDENSTYGIICKLQKRYNKKVYQVGEPYIQYTWPEEYRPLYTQCHKVTFNKKNYDTKIYPIDNPTFVASIDEILLGNELGTCVAKRDAGVVLEEGLLVREILGVSSDLMIAVEMEGKYYVFENKLHGTKTLGDMLASYGLPKVVELERFELNDNYFTLNNDDFIWEKLLECSDAKYITSPPNNNSETIRFTVTSESLGMYNAGFVVGADGYVYLNGAFFIGEEAAQEIIHYVKTNSQKAGYEPSNYSLAGTLSKVGEGYIYLSDAALCRNTAKGKSFKISIDDVHIRRYFECGKVRRGQLFIITFSGTINEKTGEVEVGSVCSITTGVSLSKESWLDILKRNLNVVLVSDMEN